MLENFYSKKGVILQKIAEELLFIKLNERIPKIADLSNRFQVGRGTIQTALKTLEKAKCIKLESRGHLGTFLRGKNESVLLYFAGVDRVTGVMPLPYSKKYEGLATGFTSALENLQLSLNIAFMRGAQLRFEGVAEGRYDFAIVSEYSALAGINENPSLSIALSFADQTYVTNHGVFFSDPHQQKIEDGMKVGIDPYSTDQKILSHAETAGKSVQFMELNYMHLLQNLRAHTIDATIWNIDEVDPSLYHIKPLSTPKALAYGGQMSRAVCVIRQDNRKIEYILGMLAPGNIINIQTQVEQGDLIPKY